MMRLARISWISSSQRPWLRHLSMCFTYDRFDRLGSKTSPQDVAYRMHHFAVDTINFRLFHWKRKHSKWLHVFFSMFFPSILLSNDVVEFSVAVATGNGLAATYWQCQDVISDLQTLFTQSQVGVSFVCRLPFLRVALFRDAFLNKFSIFSSQNWKTLSFQSRWTQLRWRRHGLDHLKNLNWSHPCLSKTMPLQSTQFPWCFSMMCQALVTSPKTAQPKAPVFTGHTVIFRWW